MSTLKPFDEVYPELDEGLRYTPFDKLRTGRTGGAGVMRSANLFKVTPGHSIKSLWGSFLN